MSCADYRRGVRWRSCFRRCHPRWRTIWEPKSFYGPTVPPGFENKKDEHGQRNDKGNGEYTVTNVHSPTLTAFLPSKDKASGAAIVIVPGGGHREIWIVHEGINEAKWLADHGIAASC